MMKMKGWEKREHLTVIEKVNLFFCEYTFLHTELSASGLVNQTRHSKHPLPTNTNLLACQNRLSVAIGGEDACSYPT